MGKLLIRLKEYWFRRPNTIRKVQEAYLMRDSRYLRNAYRYGRGYIKKTVIDHLRVIQTQKNFDFLMKELRKLNNSELEILTYAVILDYLLNKEINVSDNDSIYLNKKINLLEKLHQGQEGEETKIIKNKELRRSSTQIPIRSRMKDHLAKLEKMKSSFNAFQFHKA